jgi:hypothetical protein
MPSAWGVGGTRHPKLGAAEQPWLPYRNRPEIIGLENLRRRRAPEVPIRELLENKRAATKEETSAMVGS